MIKRLHVFLLLASLLLMASKVQAGEPHAQQNDMIWLFSRYAKYFPKRIA